MSRDDQRRQAEAFRDRHRSAPLLLLPNAWDAMSARLFAASGFAAIATSSAGVAWALGYPDGEAAPWGDVVAATARIVRAARVPVTADIEAGYGRTPAELAASIAAIIDAGAVGINLEDSLQRAEGPMRSIADAAARIAAARAAADAAGVPIVINARIDLFLRNVGEGAARFDDAVQRGRAYLAAGADCLYPIGLADPPTIAEFVRAVAAPVNIMGRPGVPGVAELERLGVARVTIASGPARLAMATTRQLAESLRTTGRFDALTPALAHAEAQQLFATGDR